MGNNAKGITLSHISSLNNWQNFLLLEPDCREKFAQMLGGDEDRGHHVINVLAKLAISHSESLAEIVLTDFFHIACRSPPHTPDACPNDRFDF